MDALDLATIRRKKNRNRNLLLVFLLVKELLPKILKDSPFSSYRVVKVYEADKTTIKSIVIYLDDSCRMSIGDYFFCAVRIDKRKKKSNQSIAFVRSKDLEADIRKALSELSFNS